MTLLEHLQCHHAVVFLFVVEAGVVLTLVHDLRTQLPVCSLAKAGEHVGIDPVDLSLLLQEAPCLSRLQEALGRHAAACDGGSKLLIKTVHAGDLHQKVLQWAVPVRDDAVVTVVEKLLEESPVQELLYTLPLQEELRGTMQVSCAVPADLIELMYLFFSDVCDAALRKVLFHILVRAVQVLL